MDTMKRYCNLNNETISAMSKIVTLDAIKAAAQQYVSINHLSRMHMLSVLLENTQHRWWREANTLRDICKVIAQ